MRFGFVMACMALLTAPSGWAQEAGSAEELLRQAQRSLRSGDVAAAMKAVDQAIEADGASVQAFALRGQIHEMQDRHQQAVADYGKVIELAGERTSAEIYQRRGCERFKLGQIEGSIADFDKYISLRPDAQRSHWQRGVAYYYAGRYGDGAKQFEGYQTFDDNDVENAVWRYLCQARQLGVEKARKSLLKIKNDPRVPMMTVYRLYAGEAQPAEVLAAARAGEPNERELNARLFYAHLYLGLYYEVNQEPAKAREHIEKAARDHKIGHYMWDVANVHAKRLNAAGRGDSKP
jgi:lipoprotein NlpI